MENKSSDAEPWVSGADRRRMLLRRGLDDDAPVVAVGAHDAMSARLIETAGFDAVWVSGFGVCFCGLSSFQRPTSPFISCCARAGETPGFSLPTR